jgi:RNA polymerase sigma-70 factor (ECF subfamily)
MLKALETEIEKTAVVLALGSEPVDFGRLPALADLSATDLTPRLSAIDARFDLDLTDSLPSLRVYALSLTHNGDRAGDLVQQTVLKALAGRDSFQTGSNFRGWLFRIQRNEFISELRRTRPTVDLDSLAAYTLSDPAQQEDGLILRDLLGAFRRLSDNARKTLLLSGLEGRTYQQIATELGIAEGTVKSRIWRGRAALARLLELPAPARGPDRRDAGPPGAATG